MIRVNTNIDQVIGKLSTDVLSLRPGGELYDKVIRTVAVSMNAVVRTRIHEKGKAADGSDIGTYSTKPMYVSVDANPGKSFGKPTGKHGQAVFKTGKRAGKPHRSKYFAGGYNEFKTAIGRNQIGKVNLSLSGQLNSQLSVIGTANGYGLGWPDDEKYNRAMALERKYGKTIWGLTDEEAAQVPEIALNVIRNAVPE